ncbi:hypothetical protein [Bremerella cremea]|uniref:hypothetical protein n=1 Tax=Bremerella cremea TaxID=1031537 RepID=UPI0031EF784D
MGLSHGGELDGHELLRKYSRVPVDQIEFVAKPTLETIAGIKRGLLFLVAFWSGPAMRAFGTLTEELADLDFYKYRFVAGDIDGAEELRELQEVGDSLMTGDGKTLWIHEGTVQGTLTPIDGRWDRWELERRVSNLGVG